MAGCRMRNGRNRDGRGRTIGLGMATVAVALAGCGVSPSASSITTTAPPKTTNPETTTPATVPPAAPATTAVTTTPTTPSTSQVSVLSAITGAVVAYETQHGVASGNYLVQGVTLSTTDPSWAKFQVNAAPSFPTTFQTAYGIAHDQGGWAVTAIGSSGVGCSGAGAVPTTVLQELGLTCS
jgi:hypothetical protein